MSQQGATWFVTALIIGASLSAFTLALAYAASRLNQVLRPKKADHMNRQITRVPIFLDPRPRPRRRRRLGLLAAGVYAYVRATGAASAEIGDVPYGAIALEFATAPLLTARITRWARHWWVVAIALTVGITASVLMLIPKFSG